MGWQLPFAIRFKKLPLVANLKLTQAGNLL